MVTSAEQQARILKRASAILDPYFLTKHADTSDATTMEKVALNRMAKILRDGLLARSLDGAKQTLQLSDDALLRITQRATKVHGAIAPDVLRLALTPPARHLPRTTKPKNILSRVSNILRKMFTPSTPEIPVYLPWVDHLREVATKTGDPKIIAEIDRITSRDIARRALRGSINFTPSVLDDKARIVRHMANRLAHHVDRLTPGRGAITYTAHIDNPLQAHTAYDLATAVPVSVNLPSAVADITPRERAQIAFHEILEALVLKRIAKLRTQPAKLNEFVQKAGDQYINNPYPFWQYSQIASHINPGVVVLEDTLGARHGGDTINNFRNSLINIAEQLKNKQNLPFSGTVSSAADLYKQVATNERSLVDKLYNGFFEDIPQQRALIRGVKHHLNLGLSPKGRLPNPTSYSASEIPFPEVYDELAQYRLRNKIRTADDKISRFL